MKAIRKTAVLLIGCSLLLLGLCGFVLPIMPGIPFLILALLVLATEFHWAGRLLLRAERRFPGVFSRVRAWTAPRTASPASAGD